MSRKPEENELNMLQQKFESAQWTTIEGCNRDRWYIPDMKGCDPQFHKLAANITDHVKQMVLHLHPRHIYITYSALKSAPLNSRRAYHTDYALDYAAHEKPFSVIITFRDPSCVLYYKDVFKGMKSVRLTIPPYSFVRFMGDVQHCGGPNPLRRPVYRLFMYFTASPAHILPINSFHLVGKKKQHDDNKK